MHRFFQLLKIGLFSFLLILGCITGLLLHARPEISQSEGRTLTTFPSFSWRTFLDGDYTAQINLWYSDTYPARDFLLDIHGDVKNFYGFHSNTFVGGSGQGDRIDPEETFIWDLGPNGDEPTEEVSGTSSEEQSHAMSEEATENEELPVENDGEVVDGYYIKASKGYQVYYFNRDYADRYARTVVQVALDLNGIADVYDLIVPTSYCYGVTEDELREIGASNGLDAISYIYRAIDSYSQQLHESGRLESPIATIDVRDALGERYKNGEYVYYRTDHHWTALGSYYVSRCFLDRMGRSYPDLSGYKEIVFDDFLGSLYRYTQNKNLEKSADTILAYEPLSVKNMLIVDKTGNEKTVPIINPTPNPSNKYECFSWGDCTYYELHNENITDGSSIMVIQESYGNAFLPFLADSYEYVYGIGYRYWGDYWGDDLASFAREHGVDTVLFLNNLMATSTYYNITTMETKLPAK